MAHVEAIARQTDRLVWAVGDRVRAQHETFTATSQLKAATFGTLLNLMPLRHHLTEDLIRRRYIYRPEHVMTAFVDDIVATELFARTDARLVPADLLSPIVDEVETAIDVTSRQFWLDHEEAALAASAMARKVLDASDSEHGLVSAAQKVDEAADPFHRFWQRLAGLRLVRNEAHVDAWREFGLGPSDVEFLTGAWAGTPLQAPGEPSEHLRHLGYAADGKATQEGLDARRRIEDSTDDRVRSAFSAVDSSAFLELLETLPPPTSRS